MTKKEAFSKVNKMFDEIFRPDDITDLELATTKAVFGLFTMANNIADSFLESLDLGFTESQIIEALKVEAIEYKPKLKAWIVDQMR